MREQHLDLYGIEYGVMNPLSPSGKGEQKNEFSAALAFAANEFQINHWNALDARLKASLIVPYEDPDASRKEIRRRAGDRRFAHVLMLTPYRRPDGLLPLTGRSMRRPARPACRSACMCSAIAGARGHEYRLAIVLCGRDDRARLGLPPAGDELDHGRRVRGIFPQLEIRLQRGGFGCGRALGYRLDRGWQRDKSALPHLKRAPSEYLREHFWVSTQPMEEPEKPSTSPQIMEAIGYDRILFYGRISVPGISTTRSSPCCRTSAKSAAGRFMRQRAGALRLRLIS